MVDNNGYVVLSERQNDTGRFFGEVEGAIMESLTESGIFKMLTIYDFQALCSLVREKESSSDMILTVSSTKTVPQFKITQNFPLAFPNVETGTEMDDH